MRDTCLPRLVVCMRWTADRKVPEAEQLGELEEVVLHPRRVAVPRVGRRLSH